MNNLFNYTGGLIISLLFISGITYYIFLFRFLRHVKINNYNLWSNYRDSAKIFESQFFTAYRIVMHCKGLPKSTLDEKGGRLANFVLYNLYITLTFFILVLFIFLYFSLNKS